LGKITRQVSSHDISCFVNFKEYFVYILTNVNRSVLYVGVTNDLERGIIEHWHQMTDNCFTSKYKVYYLLYYERFQLINQAIRREKEIKGWRREKKMKLIQGFNPGLEFLNKGLFGKWPPE
jgi:putative endonuclease